MVFLINSLPILIVIIMGLVIRYAVPSTVGKFFIGALTVFMLVVYFQIQPSYMPKGTVKQLHVAEFKHSDAKIVDRSLKPKSSEEYHAHLEDQMQKIQDSLEERIKSQSKEK